MNKNKKESTEVKPTKEEPLEASSVAETSENKRRYFRNKTKCLNTPSNW